METKMKICAICKTPIDVGLEIETPKGVVHAGVCHSMIREQDGTLNESVDTDKIQMIM